MGIEVAIAVSAAAAVASTAMSYKGQQEQKKAAKSAAADRERARQEQQEAANISSAAEKARMISERRRAAREARVRRAQILSRAENAGVAGSSGEVGSSGVINTNLGTVFSESQGRVVAAEGISARNQSASDYLASADNTILRGQMAANQWNAFAGMASTAGNLASFGVMSGAFDKLFAPDVKAQINTSPADLFYSNQNIS